MMCVVSLPEADTGRWARPYVYFHCTPAPDQGGERSGDSAPRPHLSAQTRSLATHRSELKSACCHCQFTTGLASRPLCRKGIGGTGADWENVPWIADIESAPADKMAALSNW